MSAHCKQSHTSNESAGRLHHLLTENLSEREGWHLFHSEQFALASGQVAYIVFGTNTGDVPAMERPITTHFPFSVKITGAADHELGAEIAVIVGSNYPRDIFDYDEISPSAYTPEMRLLLDIAQTLIRFCEVPHAIDGDKSKDR